MITVSKSAQEQVSAYFKNNQQDPQPIRIFVTSTCSGQSLSMALDKVTPEDSVFTHKGVDYIMETSLLEQAKPVEVEYTGTGFNITSKLELAGGCGSCGSSGSCCE
ncbi:IscA/HesB family protein [Desulfobacula phenolica]|uniref:Fe-S cluster assembly iron-binding protein IscA n=1 Tax=Desulfobacula phenolica TaxID=90732 RepID=A0A1H2HUK2_9BACT|nr:IscA/HesB family protein [Desulfobacula phenolica]SDU35395.1 Fe-S cluster assembly iron-binding protein IscA [Desulfobacula phenolica]